LQLSNGKEQWFFEDEIDLLDENGNVIKKNNNKKENRNFIFDKLERFCGHSRKYYFVLERKFRKFVV